MFYENPKIMFPILGVVLFIIVGLTIKLIKSKNNKAKLKILEEVYGTDKLLEDLGRKNISYPLIGFGKDFVEPVQIMSFEEYKKDYFYGGLGVDYIIDATGRKFFLKMIFMKELRIIDSRISNLRFNQLDPTEEIITFDKIKEIIVLGIGEDSVYFGVKKEIELAKNMDELVGVMSKGEY